MNHKLCLMLACILATSACNSQRFMPSLWSSETVTEETQEDDSPTEILQDSNKLNTSTDESGNREFLFLDSIKQENGVITAIVEYRYSKSQTLPANGLNYTHNHWLEQIDCQHKVRSIRATTHYNDVGEIIDSNEYPPPKFKPADLKALSQPNDKVIQEVCARLGLVATSSTIAEPEAQTASEPAINQPATPPANPPTKGKKGKKEETIKVDTKVDFINKDKAASTDPVVSEPQTAASAPAITDDAPASTSNKDLPPDFWTIGEPK